MITAKRKESFGAGHDTFGLASDVTTNNRFVSPIEMSKCMYVSEVQHPMIERCASLHATESIARFVLFSHWVASKSDVTIGRSGYLRMRHLSNNAQVRHTRALGSDVLSDFA